MKNNNILAIVIAAVLLLIISVLGFFFNKEREYTAQLKTELSRQRFNFEQQLIDERQRYEALLKQQREAMEAQSEREVEWIAQDIKVDETIKNITGLLKVTVSFKDKMIGGVENVKVAVTNNSAFKMEQVTVKLSYLKKGVTYTTQNVTLFEVQPHSTVSVTGPDGASGNSVTGSIYKVRSAALGHP